MRDELAFENNPEAAGNNAAQSTPAAADLTLAARQIGSRLAQSESELDDDIFEDDAAALRWRHALLRLSETFLDAAEERRDLSPILLGALHNALEQLLIHGEEADLMALEDWLGHEADLPRSTPDAESEERRTSDFLMAGANDIYNGEERRNGSDRRSSVQRRQAERRS